MKSPFSWRSSRDVDLRFTVSLRRKDQGDHGVAISRKLVASSAPMWKSFVVAPTWAIHSFQRW